MSEMIDETQIKRLFMLLHGMYGNIVLDKYRIGQVDGKGEDVGMAAARSVWLNGLQEFDAGIVLKAIVKCAEKHKSYPPSLPEFRDICKTLQPTRWQSQTSAPQLEMSDALRIERIERARKAIAETRLRREGGGHFGEGLPALHTLIAKAVGYAGGDEVGTLRQLEARDRK
jgi:hypothetical protein